MKKGRHRRYEEARALKQTNDALDDLFADNEDPCIECDALPGQDHKDWCLAEMNSKKEDAEDAEDATNDLFPS